MSNTAESPYEGTILKPVYKAKQTAHLTGLPVLIIRDRSSCPW